MVSIITFALEICRIVGGLALLLFIPGFTISLVLYPRKNDLPLVDRLVLSGTLSIGMSISVFLLMDIGLGVDTTPANDSIALFFVSILAIIVWQIESAILRKKLRVRSLSETPLRSRSLLKNFLKRGGVFIPGKRAPQLVQPESAIPGIPGSNRFATTVWSWRKKIAGTLGLRQSDNAGDREGQRRRFPVGNPDHQTLTHLPIP